MKNKSLATLILFFLFMENLLSEENKIGIGLSLFYPTGISLKYRIQPQLLVESSLGVGRGNHFHLGIQYEFYNIDNILYLYSGGAIAIEEVKKKEKLFRGIFSESRASVPGLRIPLGLSFYLENRVLEFFSEINLNIFSGSNVESYIGMALGIRAYL